MHRLADHRSFICTGSDPRSGFLRFQRSNDPEWRKCHRVPILLRCHGEPMRLLLARMHERRAFQLFELSVCELYGCCAYGCCHAHHYLILRISLQYHCRPEHDALLVRLQRDQLLGQWHECGNCHLSDGLSHSDDQLRLDRFWRAGYERDADYRDSGACAAIQPVLWTRKRIRFGQQRADRQRANCARS